MTNDDAVILPKKVAETIHLLKDILNRPMAILMDSSNFINEKGYVAVDSMDDAYPIAAYLMEDFDANLPKYMTALINGYQAELTPEEKVREYYADLRVSSDGSMFSYQAEAVEKTLDLLGKVIPGVNAPEKKD